MLLLEDVLSNEINNLLSSEPKLRLAVAFIGDGASGRIGEATDVKIVCNLTMGGTNPKEVEALIKRFGAQNVKQIDNLHAKLYIGTEYAIVSSANMSTNGLGIQPNGLREAGYKFKLDEPSDKLSLDWFDYVLWESASEITDEDLNAAEEKWQRRDRTRCGEWKADSGDICDYDFDRDDFPLITWYDKSETTVSEELMEGKNDEESDNFENKIENSVDIECDEDLDHLSKGRYIFMYRRLKSGLAARTLTGSTTFCSRGIVVKKAYYQDDDPGNLMDVMLCNKMPALFRLDDRNFSLPTGSRSPNQIR